MLVMFSSTIKEKHILECKMDSFVRIIEFNKNVFRNLQLSETEDKFTKMYFFKYIK